MSSTSNPMDVLQLLLVGYLFLRMAALAVVIRYRHVAAGTPLMMAGLVGTILGQLVHYPFLVGPIISFAANLMFFVGLWQLLRDVHSRLSLTKPVKDPLDELA